MVPATVTSVRHRLDVVTGHQDAARVLRMNDIGRVELATDKPIPLEILRYWSVEHQEAYFGPAEALSRMVDQ